MEVAVPVLGPPSTAFAPLGGAAASVTSRACPAGRLQPILGCGQSGCVRLAGSVWTRTAPTIACAQRAAQAATVSRSWTPAWPSPASMGAPAKATWVVTCVSVQLVMPVTTVRMMWTNAPPSPASTEASALTSWPVISAPAPLARWECSVRLMRMTVVQACPWTQAPGACTMVPVWTWWVASVALVPLDTLGCAVRQTSMNVTRVPAMGHTPGTACRPRVGASAASAEPASQVPAVRLSCLPVSPSHASTEASAVLARALGPC